MQSRAQARALLAAVLAIVAAAGVVVGCSSTGTVDGPTVRLAPQAVPVDAPELANPLRGQYQWLKNGPAPEDWPAPDVYHRDQIRWAGGLERVRGRYDLAAIDRGLAAAEAGKGLFSFRVMAYCPDCGGNLAPDYVPRQPDGQPDWNSEEFLSGYAALMKAIGARYDADPRLGFVDVGGYGSFGEYHLSSDDSGPIGTPITPENSRRLVQSVLDAFPSKYVLMMTPDAGLLRDALALSPRVGIRVDCVGNEGFKGSKIDEVPEALERWRTAPWIGEWCGDTDVPDQFQLGLQQVRDYHVAALSSANFPGDYEDLSPGQQQTFQLVNKTTGYRFVLDALTVPQTVDPGSSMTVTADWSNVGVTPAYLPWDVMIELRDPAGRTAWSGRSTADLATMPPTAAPVSVTDTFELPDLAPGSYSVAVRVVSPAGYLAPMQLAVAGRAGDGSYPLGTLQVED
ncbi:DUF4832 domain-containing protein [Pseudonocardia sp.]|uniref:DUF4832 domain-containing protein n=1 Tax=Pseudonocardia sp. TaxID=60912 RepID=UPI003D0A1BA6